VACAAALIVAATPAFVLMLDSLDIDSAAAPTVSAAQGGDFPMSPAPDWGNWGATGTKQTAGEALATSGQPAQSRIFAAATRSGGTLTSDVTTALNAGTIGTGPNPSVSCRSPRNFDLSGKGDVFHCDDRRTSRARVSAARPAFRRGWNS
jgi:hypothetical protein